MKKIVLILLVSLSLFSFSQNNLDQTLVGNHYLSVQWISWDYFGTAKIEKSKKTNTYTIEGHQNSKENSDFLKIKGTITPASAKHLIFNGTIETQVDFINNGQPCIREGEFNFKVKGNRKYWRLQEMNNPCSEVTDYIDIYFIQKK
ncbi:hypothetical protein [Aquimarina macrocephali]|uniref:hypothetical protein n=1 Tax=Aquimarina macrocephali TaxID=666563 RepID=UPI0004633ACB|nr:hypothetical protein [Aquimarina macrocephali]